MVDTWIMAVSVLSLPAVEWPILDISQSPGQRFWLMTYLYPIRPTFGPSSLLLKFDSFEHWDVVDGCPSRDKCAVCRDLYSLVTVKIFVHDASLQIGPLLPWPKRESPHLPRLSTAHGGKNVGSMYC